MSLHILAYNLTRAIAIFGVGPLLRQLGSECGDQHGDLCGPAGI
jgi:hypothetical protein